VQPQLWWGLPTPPRTRPKVSRARPRPAEETFGRRRGTVGRPCPNSGHHAGRFTKKLTCTQRTAAGQGLGELPEAVIGLLAAEFADVEIEVPAGNGRVLAYLAAHAEIYRQQYNDNHVVLRCYLPRHLVRHIQEPDVRVRVLGEGGSEE